MHNMGSSSLNYATPSIDLEHQIKKWEAQPLTHLTQRHETNKYAMHRGFLSKA
jgi:hypothetical protein